MRQLPTTRRRVAGLVAKSAVVCAMFTVMLSSTTPGELLPSALAASSASHSRCAPVRAVIEPSRQAPLSVLTGYALTYCTDFTGGALPAGWGRFDGVPKGDPSGRFERSHVVVGSGFLSLNTSRDPSHGGQWATGGVCQCAVGKTYGAYFVRSRVTGGSVDEAQLLWPVAPVWPPEVDFNETSQQSSATHWYVHFKPSNHQIASTRRIDITKWHTWGVVWTPTSLTFSVDHEIWGIVASPVRIPHQAMTLDLQQQTWCGIAPECPTKPVSMLVDWVVEFSRR